MVLDWRLRGQEAFLQGVTLVHHDYRRNPKNPLWDHDHCAFCATKFKFDEDPEARHEGYSTADDRHWICPRCFKDFQAQFQWTVVEG